MPGDSSNYQEGFAFGSALQHRPSYLAWTEAATPNRWIDHHSFGIDGPVMHRDEHDPNLLHVELLSYERHALIGHFQVQIKPE